MREIAVVVSNDNSNTSPTKTIDAIEKAGFRNVFVQWYDKNWEIPQEEQLKIIRGKGLNVIFAHLGYQNINDIWLEAIEGDEVIERYRNDIEKCRDNQIEMVIMHLTSHSEAPKYNQIGLERLQKLADFAEKIGVKIAFENTKIQGYLEYVIDNIKNKNVGICFDSGHFHAHFKDELNLSKFKNRIFAVHLHDNDALSDQHLLPFDGTINWENLVKDLNENGYTGPVTMELVYSDNYQNISEEEFYKKGYKIGEKLKKMFENE